MLEMLGAAEAPMVASTSGSFSMSAERTVTIIWTSLRKPLGKSGRSARSVMRPARTASVEGRPPRRGKRPASLRAARGHGYRPAGLRSEPSRLDDQLTAVDFHFIDLRHVCFLASLHLDIAAPGM